MCGIAGIFGADASPALLSRFLEKIKHRGEISYFSETSFHDSFALGTNRLAIVDEYNGKQPFFSPNADVLCVCNGEIYNHNELREKYSTVYNFKSSCDTEVILAAYLISGFEALNELQGMYSVAIYDNRTKEWYLTRDHLGIKPLFYAQNENSFFFSSELKSFEGLAVSDIATFPVGAIMKTGKFLTSQKEYSFEKKHLDLIDSDIVNKSLKFLEKAVKKMLPKTNETAICLLSGGVDSSSILTLMKENHKGPVIAYTFYNQSSSSSSEDYSAAKTICEFLNVELKTVSPTRKELTDFYLQSGVWMTETYETPLVRNAVSYYFLCKSVRSDGFKFALSGEGADELLGGYDYFKAIPEAMRDSAIERSLNNINKTYLQMADRASMYATLEVRVPFMDEEFVRFVSMLPPIYRIREQKDKWLLRNLMPNKMPLIIRNRDKTGMNQGAGFGSNDPGESIYYQAILSYYKECNTQKLNDLEVINITSKDLDKTNLEEVYNFCRYHEFGFSRLKESKIRPQLNTSALVLGDLNELDFS